MITITQLQSTSEFMHTETGVICDVEHANAQIKDNASGLWIPCVIYIRQDADYYSKQRFVKDVPDFMSSFSTIPPKAE